MRKKVSIVGAGKVGIALGYLISQKGFLLKAIGSRSQSSLENAKKYLPQTYLTNDLSEAARRGDIVFLAVKDEAIPAVANKIALKGGFRKGQIVFHLSGALTTEVLKSAKKEGAIIATLHPVQTLASIELAIANLPGSIFGFCGEKKARAVAEEVVKALDGTMVEVSEDLKPAYHAAACIASNYLVSLVYIALELYQMAGLNYAQAHQALLPLLKGTIANLDKANPVEALTGPIARGDLKTVESHLKILKKIWPEVVAPYCQLGKITVRIAQEKGLDKKTSEDLVALLERYY